MEGFKPARITERIFQNGYLTGAEGAELRALGVTHVLNLDLPYGSTRVDLSGFGFRITELLVHDKAPMTCDVARRVVAVMQRALDLEAGTIYVHCNAGLSRSPTAVWLYLVATGWDETRASATISAARAHFGAPDPVLVGGLDLADLRAWIRADRWELWHRADSANAVLAGIFSAREAADEERLAREKRHAAFAAKHRAPKLSFWIEEVRGTAT